MEAQNKFEFEQLRQEEQKNKDCITEYMKVYYQVVNVGIGLVGAVVGYYITNKPNNLSLEVIVLLYQILGFGLFAACFMSQTFALIILHKCNTHNKIAGYLRVLTREQWMPLKEDAKDKIPAQLFLWEAMQQRLGYKEGSISYSNRLSRLDKMGLVVKEVLWGLRNLILVPIKKTLVLDSWTYPVPLSFGLHAPIIAAMFVWLYYISPNLVKETAGGVSGSKGVLYVQVGLFIYLVASFLGNLTRVSLLCRDKAERTINRYATFFYKRRIVLLKRNYGIDVKPWYEAWDVWAEKDLRARIQEFPDTTECVVIYSLIPVKVKYSENRGWYRFSDTASGETKREPSVFSCVTEAQKWIDKLAEENCCKNVHTTIHRNSSSRK